MNYIILLQKAIYFFYFTFLTIMTILFMIEMKGGILLNNLMLVGRIAQDIEIKTSPTGKEVTTISIAVNRSFKNIDGIYETDFIDCVLWDGLAKNINEYCHKGDMIGIRGRLQTSFYEKDEVKHKYLEVIAEKLTFISSKRATVEEAGE